NCFHEWPVLPLNFVYADVTGKIGWQLTGQAPKRRKGWGTVPQPGWEPEAGWEKELVPFEQMPHLDDPKEGFVASANNAPPNGTGDAYLGVDFLDPFRYHAIRLELDDRNDWDVSRCQQLQMNVDSLPWSDMRLAVLAVPISLEDTRL